MLKALRSLFGGMETGTVLFLHLFDRPNSPAEVSQLG